ncbi:MAG TPA: hypothetical protein VFE65_12865 [Pseudonocardia sp.]|nr:hypothetical protein [Pseudonocardia sp.]
MSNGGSVVRNVVVIGGGAGGGALAHRLLRDPDVSVLLIEAGSDDRPVAVAAPARWPETLGGPLDWGYRTTPQAGLGGRVLDYHQGRVLGGTTCLYPGRWNSSGT